MEKINAKIIMLKKKKNNIDIGNFRPISLLPTIGKLLESVIADRLTKWAEDNNQINQEQSGFRKNRGVNDQLFIFQQFLTQTKNRKRHMHAVFIDFSKAFDTIDHKKLLFKLKQKNIPKTLLLLFKSYLENRTCFIHTNGIDSQCFTPMAGVPQGSCISPILFSLFVSDISKSVICKLSQFADDIAIFNIFNNHKNRNALQDYLNQIVEWCGV